MCFVMDLRESLEIVSLKISEYLITGRFCPIYRSERSEYSRNWKIGGKFGQFEKKSGEDSKGITFLRRRKYTTLEL